MEEVKVGQEFLWKFDGQGCVVEKIYKDTNQNIIIQFKGDDGSSVELTPMQVPIYLERVVHDIPHSAG